MRARDKAALVATVSRGNAISPSPSQSQLRGVFAMSVGVLRYRLQTSVPTGYVLRYLLQQQQLHNGN